MKALAKRLALVVSGVLVFVSVAQASVSPQWVELDVNKDNQKEFVALNNLADIAFNERGEVVGWYFKQVKGTDFKNNYERAPNLVAQTSAVLLGPAGAASANAPVLQTQTDPKTQNVTVLTGKFVYTQAGARIEKTYTINTRTLTVALEVAVQGVAKPKLEFYGLGGGQPKSKALGRGATEPLASGLVKDTVYASFQCCSNIFGAIGEALVVKPAAQGVAAEVGQRDFQRQTDKGTETLQRAFVSFAVPQGTSQWTVYGGGDELIRFAQEGYSELPGLFAPNILGQISVLMMRLLEWMRGVVGSWGLAIILFSVLIRLVQWPLMQRSAKSMTAVQMLQPEIAKLREKHKNDPQKLNAETMKLYQEKNANPLGGCLPMLVPMPVLLVLWKVFSYYEFDQSFLWVRDLSLPDPFYILGVLYIAVNIFSLWVNTRSNPDMFRQQAPIYIVFVMFAFSVPAGTALYWVATNVVAVAQQWLINRQFNLNQPKKAEKAEIAMAPQAQKKPIK